MAGDPTEVTGHERLPKQLGTQPMSVAKKLTGPGVWRKRHAPFGIHQKSEMATRGCRRGKGLKVEMSLE